jgi:hypothetical protein
MLQKLITFQLLSTFQILYRNRTIPPTYNNSHKSNSNSNEEETAECIVYNIERQDSAHRISCKWPARQNIWYSCAVHGPWRHDHPWWPIWWIRARPRGWKISLRHSVAIEHITLNPDKPSLIQWSWLLACSTTGVQVLFSITELHLTVISVLNAGWPTGHL